MYGIKKAGVISYKRLVKNLQPHGYAPVENSLVLCTHYTLPTTFNLSVDDFGIKFFANNDATHLLDSLKKHYYITIECYSRNYHGITIDWNYPKHYVDTYPCLTPSTNHWNASNIPPPNAPNILLTNGLHLCMLPKSSTLLTLQPHQNLKTLHHVRTKHLRNIPLHIVCRQSHHSCHVQNNWL